MFVEEFMVSETCHWRCLGTVKIDMRIISGKEGGEKGYCTSSF